MTSTLDTYLPDSLPSMLEIHFKIKINTDLVRIFQNKSLCCINLMRLISHVKTAFSMKISKGHAHKVIFCNSKSVLSYLCTNPINFSICLKAQFETHEELGHWTMVSLQQRFLSYDKKKIPLPSGSTGAFPFVCNQY